MDNSATGALLPSNFVDNGWGLRRVRGARGMQGLPPELLVLVLRRVSGAGGLGGPLHFALVCRRFAAVRFQAAVLLMREGRRQQGPVLARELQVYQGPTTVQLSSNSVCGLRALWRGLSNQGPSLTAIRVGYQDATCVQCEDTCQHLGYRRDTQLCGRHGQASAGWAFSRAFLRAHPGLRSLSIRGHYDNEADVLYTQSSTDCQECCLCFHGPDSAVSTSELQRSLSNLTHLSLKSVNLCWPRNWLSALPALKSLHLGSVCCHEDSDRSSSSIDLDTVLSMTSLTSLSLGLWWKSFVRKDFEGLPNLKSLSLALVGFQRGEDVWAPASIWALTGLTRLCLDFPGPISKDDLGELVGLKVLKLVKARIEDLPGSLQALESAKLSCCELKSFGIGECISLKRLVLDGCLSEDWGQVAHLTELKLENLRSRELPGGFGRLTGLKKLIIIHSSHLEKLPADLGKLASLTILRLEKLWAIRELPHGFEGLEALRSLEIVNCRNLWRLPAGIGLLKSWRDGSLRILEPWRTQALWMWPA